MAKTGTERQADLRVRKAEQNKRQLNVWVSEESYLALKKISDEHDITMGDALEQLLQPRTKTK